MARLATYDRVSTPDQDPQRQRDELREYVRREHPDSDVREYSDVISAAIDDRGEEFERLWSDIEAGEFDLVVVHEISRLSRLGAGSIHEFIEHCLSHETGVKDLEVGLSVELDDDVVDRAVSTMIAGIMGDLARIEHKQQLRRINTGIRAAQRAGKWTGRPPRGFEVDQTHHLRVDIEEFLHTRSALELVATGESKRSVVKETGIPESTLRRLYNDEERRAMYLEGEAEDDRVAAAIEDVRPLPELNVDAQDDAVERIREIVREEIEARG